MSKVPGKKSKLTRIPRNFPWYWYWHCSHENRCPHVETPRCDICPKSSPMALLPDRVKSCLAVALEEKL